MSRTITTKSSDLANIIDMANAIIKKAESCQVYHDQLIKDSQRLKEISPAINKMLSALSPTIPATLENTGIGTVIITESTSDHVQPTKKSRRAKKATDVTEETPPT